MLWSCGNRSSLIKRPKEDISYLKLGILQVISFTTTTKKPTCIYTDGLLILIGLPPLSLDAPAKPGLSKRLWPISLLKTSLFAQRRVTTFRSNASFCLELGSRAESLLVCFYLVVSKSFFNYIPIKIFEKCFDIIFAINSIINKIGVFVNI